MRLRLLDLAVATVCVACVGAPALPSVIAATNPAVVETGGTVDQRVLPAGWISNPLDGRFESGGSGIVDGSVSWSQYTTTRKGAKLVISSDRNPAMRDARNGVDIPDYDTSLSTWSVTGSDRRFGFSAAGPIALSRYDSGRKWRGFEGRRSVEVARRGLSFGSARTTIKLRAEFESALDGDARPTANIRATAVPNL